MVDYSNPFLTSFLGSRNQFTQPQNQFNQQQNQYDFSGWGDRLGKIEEGIAGLTKQFNSFQTPGDVAPEYQGNAAPEPLEQSANAPEPLGGIESLVAEPAPAAPTPMATTPTTPTPSPFGGGKLEQRVATPMPGDPNYVAPTPEQIQAQQDLMQSQSQFNTFAGAANEYLMDEQDRGFRPMFYGHAYQDWQGADQSQGMENFLSNYDWKLPPIRPDRAAFTQEFQAANPIGLDTTGTSTWYNTHGQPVDMGAAQEQMNNQQVGWQQIQADFESSPEHQEWQQYQSTLDPLTQSTMEAMGMTDMLRQGRPAPQQLTGLGGGRERPGWTGGTRPNDMAMPVGGYMTRPQIQSALGGPTQQKIQQGIGALV